MVSFKEAVKAKFAEKRIELLQKRAAGKVIARKARAAELKEREIQAVRLAKERVRTQARMKRKQLREFEKGFGKQARGKGMTASEFVTAPRI